jgi:hydrogenase-4 component B
LRLVLEVVLRPVREISSKTEGGVLQEVAYSGNVPHLIEDRLYRPAERVAFRAALHVRRLQSGSIGTYVVYLIGLVVLLLLGARLGVFG